MCCLLVDADILKDADRFKMDLIGGLERTLHGEVKPSMLFLPTIAV
jgi:U3 small nucleolar RNA-associated protein 23